MESINWRFDFIYHNIKWIIAVAIKRDNIILSIHIKTISNIVNGISVDRIQGMDAAKNNISDTLIIPTINLVLIGDWDIIIAGNNISDMLMALAFAAKNGSGILSNKVNG